jgi:hypothetical protein
MSKLIVRLIVVLALSAFLGSPAASLAGSRHAMATARRARVQAVPQSLLSRVWNSLVSVWEKEGCRIDPNGRCITVAAPVPEDSLQTTLIEKYGWHLSSD